LLEDKEQETKAKDQQFEESKEQVIDTAIVCMLFSFESGSNLRQVVKNIY